MSLPFREIVNSYSLGNLPGYGNVIARLSETIYSISSGESLAPEPIVSTLDAQGSINALWPETANPDIRTLSGRPAYMRVIENVGRASPTSYRVEVPDEDGPMNLATAPHLNDGSQDFPLRGIDTAYIVGYLDKGIEHLTLPAQMPTHQGEDQNLVSFNEFGIRTGGTFVDYALQSALDSEEAGRISTDDALTAMFTSLTDPTTGLIPDLRNDLTAETAARAAADAAIQAELDGEEARALVVEGGLNQRVVSVEASVAGLGGQTANRLPDTYGNYVDPGVDWGGRVRWYNPTNLTRSTDPSRSPFNEPTLIMGTALADGGRYMFLDEAGLLTTDAVSVGASVKQSSGSAQLGIIWYNASGAQGAVTYGPSQSMDGSVKRLVLQNQVPPDGTTIKAAIFVHRASGPATDIYDMTVTKAATASAVPLPPILTPNLFSEVVAARGSAASLDARLDATLYETGVLRATDAFVKDLIEGGSYVLQNVVPDADGIIDTADVKYTNGATGTWDTTSTNTVVGIPLGVTFTYADGTVSKTFYRPATGWTITNGDILSVPELSATP